MSTTGCGRGEALRDYVFDELPAAERPSLEQHIAGCAECAADLDQLRLTTAALRVLPEREIPQRIAFVSDKVFEPSPWAKFFRSGWAGFASAAMMAAALVFTVLHRPAPEVRTEVRTVIQTAAGADVSKQIDDAVEKAVRQVRTEDAQLTRAALAEADAKHEKEHRMLMVQMEQSMEFMEKKMGTLTSLASLEMPRGGGGQ